MILSELAKYGINPILPDDPYIYKYTSFESALKIIENNSLKFSLPQEFNDPFEMTNALIDTKYTKPDLREWLDSFPDFSNSKKKQLFQDYNKKPAEVIKAFNISFNKFKNNTGICCFSKSYKKTLMWSHYSDNHSGICLGFYFSSLSSNEELLLLTVNYIDKVISVNYFREKLVSLFYWIFTKSKIWEYEEEVRAVHTNGSGLLKFEKECLKEVYFGLKVSEENKVKFISKLKELGYKVEKISSMNINSATFDLKEKHI